MIDPRLVLFLLVIYAGVLGVGKLVAVGKKVAHGVKTAIVHVVHPERK